MNHATVKLGDYLIALIGIPEDAALEQCDLCHDLFPLWEITISLHGLFFCEHCSTHE